MSRPDYKAIVRHIPKKPCGDCSQKNVPAESLSIVVASRNEGAKLDATLDALFNLDIPFQPIVIDDCSDTPEKNATLRLAEWTGCSQSRHIGCNMAAGPWVLVMDAHMKPKREDVLRVWAAAREHGGIAYSGCNGQGGAELCVDPPSGLLRCKWSGSKGDTPYRTTGMMGAWYLTHKDTLKRMGGWPRLMGKWGMDEEAVSIIAARCNIPIWYVPTANPWHDFSERTVSMTEALLSIVSLYRLCFGDDLYTRWRDRLHQPFSWDGRIVEIPEWVFEKVETAAYAQYAETVRAGFTVPELTWLLDQWPAERIR